ncbi:ion channel protein [Demequina capsici]|uniref:Ion channel protein n=1 Tax=Demequina capsici TaxID=3075620 RepID=A0AA96FFT6_9MICO|nr:MULTISPECIES: ion channel protein [unclassified Demequina]WNM24839.1 ion channel protein [Demequina sp. OYTSA14]WNM27746.1 ion channel protein [Demequina sp. PMTSA13]
MSGAPHPSPRQLALVSIPALIVGVLSGLLLAGIDMVSEGLEHVLWDGLPSALGVEEPAGWWTLIVLSGIGLLVGLAVWKVPGHGGHDSATVELFAPVLRISALPGVALVLILGLAGGVSLGPESPIIAIDVALTVWLLGRIAPNIGQQGAFMLAAAGMLGAMFGTPVAAALLMTELVAAAKRGGLLWDRLFAPLIAAGAATITMQLLHAQSFKLDLPEYTTPHLIDLVTASVVALIAAVFGMAASITMPPLHALFRRLNHPVAYATAGGVVLGLLGWVGGPLTLFKGAAQTGDLISHLDSYGTWQLLGLALVKTAALVVAAAAGFRGGRIFPAVFIGAAAGLFGHALMPSMPLALAVAAGVLGAVLAIGRNGWLALFMAAVFGGSMASLSVLTIALLPVWLLVARAPEMLVGHGEIEQMDERDASYLDPAESAGSEVEPAEE